MAPRHVLAAVGAVTVVGAALRLYGLGRESLWYDEMISLRIARGGWPLVLSEAASGREPLFYSLLVLWRSGLGESETAIRSISALAGIAAIPLQFLMVRQVAGPLVGLVGAFLLAVLPTHIHYSQEARAYALMLTLALASQVAFTRLSSTSRRRDWILYLVPTAAMLYTHATAIFFLAGQNAVWWICRRHAVRARDWGLSQALLALVALPIIGEDATQIAAGSHSIQNWIGAASPRELWFNLRWLFVPSPAIVRSSSLVRFFALVLLLRLLLVLWGRGRAGRSSSPIRGTAGLTFALLALPPFLGPFLLAEVFGNTFIFRYTLGAMPALCGLVALLLVPARPRLPDVVPLLLIAFAIGLVMPRLVNVRLKEPWREAVRFAESSALAGDANLVTQSGGFGTLRSLVEYYGSSQRVMCEARRSLLSCQREGVEEAPSTTRFWTFFRTAFSTPERERARLERTVGQHVGLSMSRYFRDVGVLLLEVAPTPAATGPSAVAAPPVAR